MTATACSDPFEGPERPPLTDNNLIPTTEFHTMVTTWNRTADNNYVGLVSTTPITDLSKAQLYGIKNGLRISIDNYGDVSDLPYGDVSKRPAVPSAYDDYLWANVKNNVLLLNYKGSTAESLPPVPLEVVIAY
jgi:hypothetical protein